MIDNGIDNGIGNGIYNEIYNGIDNGIANGLSPFPHAAQGRAAGAGLHACKPCNAYIYMYIYIYIYTVRCSHKYNQESLRMVVYMGSSVILTMIGLHMVIYCLYTLLYGYTWLTQIQ